ncbi:hypothetical protein PENSPDRAFT_672326 [Peniophora sp. CONT]|nr:hypothetical protein PENSPDRAFT_672326 [Peniophora sp. CONT]
MRMLSIDMSKQPLCNDASGIRDVSAFNGTKFELSGYVRKMLYILASFADSKARVKHGSAIGHGKCNACQNNNPHAKDGNCRKAASRPGPLDELFSLRDTDYWVDTMPTEPVPPAHRFFRLPDKHFHQDTSEEAEAALDDTDLFGEGVPDDPENLHGAAVMPMSSTERQHIFRARQKIENMHVSESDKAFLCYMRSQAKKCGFGYEYVCALKPPEDISPYAKRDYKGTNICMHQDDLHSECRLRAHLHRAFKAVPSSVLNSLQVQREIADDFIVATLKRWDNFEREIYMGSFRTMSNHTHGRRVLLRRAAGLWQERELLKYPPVMYNRAQDDNLLILLGCPCYRPRQGCEISTIRGIQQALVTLAPQVLALFERASRPKGVSGEGEHIRSPQGQTLELTRGGIEPPTANPNFRDKCKTKVTFRATTDYIWTWSEHVKPYALILHLLACWCLTKGASCDFGVMSTRSGQQYGSFQGTTPFPTDLPYDRLLREAVRLSNTVSRHEADLVCHEHHSTGQSQSTPHVQLESPLSPLTASSSGTPAESSAPYMAPDEIVEALNALLNAMDNLRLAPNYSDDEGPVEEGASSTVDPAASSSDDEGDGSIGNGDPGCIAMPRGRGGIA